MTRRSWPGARPSRARDRSTKPPDARLSSVPAPRRGSWAVPIAVVVVAVVLAAGWVLFFGLGRGARLSKPNVLWIVMNATRPDHLSVYGYDRLTTPALARLAAEGVVFENAVVPSMR